MNDMRCNIYGDQFQFDSGYSSLEMKAVQGCADQGANVVSLSLVCNNCLSQTEQMFHSNIFKKNNVLLIAAAGNSGDSARSYPASFQSFILEAENTEATIFQNQVNLNDEKYKRSAYSINTPSCKPHRILNFRINMALIKGEWRYITGTRTKVVGQSFISKDGGGIENLSH